MTYDQLPDFSKYVAANFTTGQLTSLTDEFEFNGLNIKIKDQSYPVDKVIYYLAYGIWCTDILHLDGNQANNKLSNLVELASARKRFINEPLRASYYNENHPDVDYYDLLEQGTSEWLEMRKNRISGTTAYDLLRNNPLQEVLHKNNIANFKGNYYTERGHRLEEEGRRIYSEVYQKVNEVGAIINTKYPQTLYSPDGLIGESGLFEHKAFTLKHHYSAIKAPDAKILAQIQFGLFVSERDWCDLVLYNPDVEIADSFIIKRITPNPVIQTKFKEILVRN